MIHTNKIDVLDLVINVLTEHEKKLDHTVTELEQKVIRLEKAVGVKKQ